MKIKVTNGRVTFNGEEFSNLNLDLQLEADKLTSKVDNDYTLSELMEMIKAKAKEQGMEVVNITIEKS